MNYEPYYHYYRRDHLGNNREVCWVERSGGISTSQRTQYYPSGLPWESNAGDNPYVQPNKYNGKEFIEMHGLDEYDSQARWYYPAIMRTTIQDPLAEKYYNISPYVWCGNNPVKYIDPNGREIRAIYEDEEGKRQQLLYKSGNLYDTKGNLYEGNNQDALTILETVNNIKSADDFTDHVITTLENSDKNHYIEIDHSNNKDNYVLPYPRHYVDTEKGNPSGTQTVVTLNGEPIENNLKTTNETTLGHELRHAYDYDQGLMKGMTFDSRNGTSESPAEIRAVGFENRIREALSIPLRTTYGKPIKPYPYAK